MRGRRLDAASSTYLFIVADGMGGQLAGEKASQMAVEHHPQGARPAARPGDEADAKADPAADPRRRRRGQPGDPRPLGRRDRVSQHGDDRRPRPFRNDRVYVAGIGDSRAYRLRDGRIEQLTKDHSLADALVEAGTITKEELPNHKFKHVLYLYLGSKDARGGPEDVRVARRPARRPLPAGHRRPDRASSATRSSPRSSRACDDPQRAARVLIDQALENDSKDNVTCLVIHVV